MVQTRSASQSNFKHTSVIAQPKQTPKSSRLVENSKPKKDQKRISQQVEQKAKVRENSTQTTKQAAASISDRALRSRKTELLEGLPQATRQHRTKNRQQIKEPLKQHIEQNYEIAFDRASVSRLDQTFAQDIEQISNQYNDQASTQRNRQTSAHDIDGPLEHHIRRKLEHHLNRDSDQVQSIEDSEDSSFVIPTIEPGQLIYTPASSEIIVQRTPSASISCESDEVFNPELAISLNDREIKLVKLVLRHIELFSQAMATNEDDKLHLEKHRNVSLEECAVKDTFQFGALESPLRGDENTGPNDAQQALWEYDRKKCRKDDESLFQRTILVSMIDRGRLFTANHNTKHHGATGSTSVRTDQGLDKTMTDSARGPPIDFEAFDYFMEKTWDCPPMPTRSVETRAGPEGTGAGAAGNQEKGKDKNKRKSKETDVVEKPGPRRIETMPKPDLCVCFRASKVLPVDYARCLDPDLVRMITLGLPGRAFPFLIVEAKNPQKSPDDEHALKQVLNAASQGLHNLFEFFREADMIPIYFEKVRIFTVTTTALGCLFRMHRPRNIEPLYSRILPDYPLAFEYDLLREYVGNEIFTRQNVVDMFEKIIWGYGPILKQLIMEASAVLQKKLNAGDESIRKRPDNYYRHYQDYVWVPPSRAGSKTADRKRASKQLPVTGEPTPSASQSRDASRGESSTPVCRRDLLLLNDPTEEEIANQPAHSFHSNDSGGIAQTTFSRPASVVAEPQSKKPRTK